MSPSHSNGNNSNPSGRGGASLATPMGIVKALDDLIARFPRMDPNDESGFVLSLPPSPKPGATGPDDVKARFDDLAVRVAALLHKSEASGRENKYLRRVIEDSSRRTDGAPKNPEQQNLESSHNKGAHLPTSLPSFATATGMVQALDDLLARFPQTTSKDETAFELSLPHPSKRGTEGVDDIQTRLDTLSVRIEALLHNTEASGRENVYLRRLIKSSRKDPPKDSEGPDTGPSEEKQ